MYDFVHLSITNNQSFGTQQATTGFGATAAQKSPFGQPQGGFGGGFGAGATSTCMYYRLLLACIVLLPFYYHALEFY